MNFFEVESIKEFAKKLHEQNVRKGFWEKENSSFKQICLINSELSEAVEGHRLDKHSGLKNYLNDADFDGYLNEASFIVNIKGSVEVELADAWMRIVDWHYYLRIEKPRYEFKRFYFHNDWFGEDWHDGICNITDSVLKIREDESKTLESISFARCAIEAFAEMLEIDLESYIKLKMRFNATREKYHGKAY